MLSVSKIVFFVILLQLCFSATAFAYSISFDDASNKEKEISFNSTLVGDLYNIDAFKLKKQKQILDLVSESASVKYLNPLKHTSTFAVEPENTNVLGMFLMLGYGKLRYNIYEKAYYKMDYSITKGGGVSYEIPLEALDGKFSVYNELGFSLFKSEAKLHYADTIGGDPVNNYYDVNLLFSPNTVFLSNTLRYCLTKSEFEYYVSIGISNSFVVSSTNTKETLHTIQGSTERYVDEFVPDPAIHGISVLISTGFSYKNIGFEMRFDPGRNYSNQIHYAVYMPSFLGLVHVRFTPK